MDDAAIIERLDRIERAIAALAELSAGARTAPARGHRASGKAYRLTTAETLAALRCSETTLRGHVARGLLAPIRPKGKGRGKPVYYRPDEVAALAVSEDAARELVARRNLAARQKTG